MHFLLLLKYLKFSFRKLPFQELEYEEVKEDLKHIPDAKV